MAIVIQRARLELPQDAALVAIGAIAASITFIAISLLVLALGHRLDRPLDWARKELVKYSASIVPGFLVTSGVVPRPARS